MKIVVYADEYERLSTVTSMSRTHWHIDQLKQNGKNVRNAYVITSDNIDRVFRDLVNHSFAPERVK